MDPLPVVVTSGLAAGVNRAYDERGGTALSPWSIVVSEECAVAAQQIEIFDDDSAAALITQRGLQALLGRNVLVSIASSANDAWLACARGDIDLLILDPSPRSGSAFALLRAVRAYRPDLPVLVLTAYDTPGLRTRMALAGVGMYAAKPIDLRELAPIVRDLLQHSPAGSGGAGCDSGTARYHA
jgi:two-component system OmpR family response regulator